MSDLEQFAFENRFLRGDDVLGEQGAPYPAAPHDGPYIGRSSRLNKGERVSVFTSKSIGAIGESVTLCLAIANDPQEGEDPSDPLFDAPVIGELNFGAGGGGERVLFDWLTGTMITPPAGTVQLRAVYPVTDHDAFISAPVRQQVTCFVAKGLRTPSAGITPHARFTVRANGGSPIVHAAGAVVTVPNRAVSVMLLTSDPDSYGSALLSYRTTQSLVGGPGIPGTPIIGRQFPSNSNELVIPAGTRTVEILNNGPAATLTLVFGLAL